MTNEADEREEAGTVTKTGKGAKSRFPTCGIAIAVYKRMRTQGEKASIARANIQGAYDGNPPYSRSELIRHGIEWMTNIDWGEFRAAINRNVSSVWNMFNSVPTFIRLFPRKPSRDNLNPSKDWGTVIANEYTRTLKNWNGYHYLIRARLTEMFKFGIGWCFWPDKFDWRSRFVRSSNVLFESSTRATIGGLEVLALRDELTLTEILGMIEDEDIAEEAGWNVTYLRKKLVDIFKDGNRQDFTRKYAITDWESILQATKNNDFMQQITEFDPLRVVYLMALVCTEEYNREEQELEEYTDTVQQVAFVEDDDDNTGEYIFESMNAGYESIESFAQPIMFSSGDGYMASVRGLGREIFHFAHASNRLMNSILTGVDIASGLLIQGQSNGALERMAITKAGPITRIPQDLTILQQQYMPNIQSAADARQIIQALQNNNTGMYKNRFESSKARTAEEVRTESANEARFENDQAEWYYVQHERWHGETFARLMRKDYKKTEPGYREHKQLIKRLKDMGCPAEMLDPDYWNLVCSRAIGMGSPSMRLSITNDMVGMSSRLDEAGRRNVDKEWFAARASYDNVSVFVSDQSRDQIPTIDHAMAESENVDMLSGNIRTVTVDDAHKFHMDFHLRAAGDIIEKFKQQQMAPEQALQSLFALLQHMQGHLQYLQQDKTREPMVKFYMQAMQQYQQIAMQIKQVVEQNQQQKQKQQEAQQKKLQEADQVLANREHDTERYKIDQNVALEKYKADQLNEARVSKSMAAVQANQMRLEQEIQAMGTRTMAEIERKAAESAAKIESMRQQNEEKANKKS